jgi:hypothetical protein
MARSSHVYIVVEDHVVAPPIAGFTVKWELQLWFDTHAHQHGALRIYRMVDNPSRAGDSVLPGRVDITEEITA